MERCSIFVIRVHLNDGGLTWPHKEDKWIMVKFAETSFGENKLEKLNKVRIHQQVLFWSCVIGASGKYLDAKYMRKRELDENWSNVKF